jgi:hypothetical protein
MIIQLWHPGDPIFVFGMQKNHKIRNSFERDIAYRVTVAGVVTVRKSVITPDKFNLCFT